MHEQILQKMYETIFLRILTNSFHYIGMNMSWDVVNINWPILSSYIGLNMCWDVVNIYWLILSSYIGMNMSWDVVNINWPILSSYIGMNMSWDIVNNAHCCIRYKSFDNPDD